MRGRAVERGRFFDLLAGCRISECHGRSVLTRKLWHSTRFEREPRCGGGCPAIHKPRGAVGKLFFLGVYARGFQAKLFTGKAKWWLALALGVGEAPLLA